MMSEVELDDIEVVEVTGKSHHDKVRDNKNEGCCTCNLRSTSITIFVSVAVVYVVGVAIGSYLMFSSLETLDMEASNHSINRLSMLIQDDGGKLIQLIGAYGRSDDAATSIRNLLANPEDPEEAIFPFLRNRMNTTPVAYDESGKPTQYIYGVGNEITYWAFLDTEYNTKYAVYYPKGPGDTGLVGTKKHFPAPVIHASVFKNIVEDTGNQRILKVLVPDEGDDKAMMTAMVEITDPKDVNQTILGFLVAGRALLPRLKQYSDDAPSCVVMQDGSENADIWDDVDREYFAKVVPGTFGLDKTYGGKAAFIKRDKDVIEKARDRFCPNLPLFQATDSLMAGYFSLCGLDPNNKRFKDGASCFLMRVDRPMCIADKGTVPIVSLSTGIIILMIILCIFFVLFLDYMVLRRIVNLSNVIKQQTKGHADALKDQDENPGSESEGEAEGSKSGSGASGSSEGSSISANSTDTTASSGKAPAPPRKSARDEIDNLKRAMEQNAIGLRKRLEAVNDSIKVEIQKNIRQKQAIQLLNLWCVRKDFFPGLRGNAIDFPYEPPRNIDELLSNPLAVEYLKNHCDADRTLENLWFILDVSWLKDVEAAEDIEEDEADRAEIHDIAVYTAKTIIERYIVENAPQQINLSAGTFKKLREKKHHHYSRGMFEDAVGEVKLMLDTDVLPRFQKTASYTAMIETLAVDSAGDEESSFSEDTVSTTGSILTEDGEGDVTRMFAHTFKNLDGAFDVGHDDNSSTISASSSVAGAKAPSVVSGTVTIASGTVTVASEYALPEKTSSKDGVSKLKEETTQEEEAKKDSEESSNSSDSSSKSSSSSYSSSLSVSEDSE